MKIDDDTMSFLKLTWAAMQDSSEKMLSSLKGVQNTRSLNEGYDGGDGGDDFDDDVTTLEELMREIGEIMIKYGIYCV